MGWFMRRLRAGRRGPPTDDGRWTIDDTASTSASMPRRVSTATIARRYAALARMSSIGRAAAAASSAARLTPSGEVSAASAASASGARSGVGPTAPRAIAQCRRLTIDDGPVVSWRRWSIVHRPPIHRHAHHRNIADLCAAQLVERAACALAGAVADGWRSGIRRAAGPSCQARRRTRRWARGGRRCGP